ncbi:MAG: response regulator [Ignavibacteria bacterium]|nr:response regulator [Ignavibacteria bacterium]
MRAVIVDDETLARNVIREYLNAHKDISIVGECENGLDAVRVITEMAPDLLFLDVQMPKLNGFEVLELVDHDCAVVFITAHDHYALKAFDVHAVDYILKPFRRERFDEALERARSRRTVARAIPKQELLHTIHEQHAPIRRIVVREGTKVLIIPINDVDYIQAQDDYIAVHAAGKSHLKQQRLSNLERLIDAGQFMRIHRSYLVNVERIVRIEVYEKESRQVILKTGARLPVSRSGYARLKDILAI